MHAYTSSCLLEREDDSHIHSYHAGSRVHKHSYISGRASLKQFSEHFHYINASSCLREIWLMIDTHTHPYLRLIACTNAHAPRGAFLFHTFRSVSLTCMQRYMQLAYLFHQCWTSLLNRDGGIADVAMRHPGVVCTFSCIVLVWCVSISQYYSIILIRS